MQNIGYTGRRCSNQIQDIVYLFQIILNSPPIREVTSFSLVCMYYFFKLHVNMSDSSSYTGGQCPYIVNTVCMLVFPEHVHTCIWKKQLYLILHLTYT